MYPEHPDTIVVKNKFYLKGLTELEIYNYYMSVKDKLLKETHGRDLMFYISIDPDRSPILKRYSQGKTFYELTSENYEKMITGRTISIHSTMNDIENIGVVDIDHDNFDESKDVTLDVYNYLKSLKEFKTVQIRFTGKTSFHVVGYFHNSMPIGKIFYFLNHKLNIRFPNYDVSSKRTEGKPNLDLYRNKFRGGFITLYSLSILGLKCMAIDPNKLSGFNLNMAKIG